MSKTLEVGQELWYVPSDTRREAKAVIVTKVGRKWATLDNHNRVDMETMDVDGGNYSSPGTCYLDRKAYEEQCRANKLFMEFYRKLGYCVKRGVTAEDILQAAKLLHIEIEGES